MPLPPRVLSDTRILSLALNLPGPAALMRCQGMGATCTKLEPPAGDPMARYSAAAYTAMHAGVRVITADLKTSDGQEALHRELDTAHVLLTSFRPSALARLGLGWDVLHVRYPALSHVGIVGAGGSRAEEPGHDLTYLAQHDLLPGLELPATLYADMGGSLRATEAILEATLLRRAGLAAGGNGPPSGVRIEVALADAVAYLGLPREWGLTAPGGVIGGGHAGYRIYECRDGRVAVAALEPHFAATLCDAAGLEPRDAQRMMTRETAEAIAAFCRARTRRELDRLAVERDIPLHTLPPTSV